MFSGHEHRGVKTATFGEQKTRKIEKWSFVPFHLRPSWASELNHVQNWINPLSRFVTLSTEKSSILRPRPFPRIHTKKGFVRKVAVDSIIIDFFADFATLNLFPESTANFPFLQPDQFFTHFRNSSFFWSHDQLFLWKYQNLPNHHQKSYCKYQTTKCPAKKPDISKAICSQLFSPCRMHFLNGLKLIWVMSNCCEFLQDNYGFVRFPFLRSCAP